MSQLRRVILYDRIQQTATGYGLRVDDAMSGSTVGGFQYHVKRLTLQTFASPDHGIFGACLFYGVALPRIGNARDSVVIDVLSASVQKVVG
jgi:hypothetical protein